MPEVVYNEAEVNKAGHKCTVFVLHQLVGKHIPPSNLLIWIGESVFLNLFFNQPICILTAWIQLSEYTDQHSSGLSAVLIE